MKRKNGVGFVVNGLDECARCRCCGSDITQLGSFTFTDVTVNCPRYRLEQNRCTQCGKSFFFRYNIFKTDGHINDYVWGSSIDDDAFQWESQWTAEQVRAIHQHLNDCFHCRQSIDDSLLADAFLGSLIHDPEARSLFISSKQ